MQAIFKSFKDAQLARVRGAVPVAARRARGCGWAIQPTRRQTARHGPNGRERVATDADRAPTDRILGPPWRLSTAGGMVAQSL